MGKISGGVVHHKCKIGLKLAAVLLAQFGIFAFLAYNVPYSYQGSTPLKNIPQDKQSLSSTGYFRLIKDFTNDRGVAHWDISADDLSIINSRVGIFTTYMSRKAYVKGLNLKVHTDIAAPEILTPAPKPSVAAAGISKHLAGDSGEFAASWFIDMDSSNIFSLLADGFSCEIFDNEKLSLSVKSRRASITDKTLTILLEGAVVIVTDDGRTLKANKVRWDITGKTFTAQGPYMLTDADKTKNGRDITLNYQGCNLAIPFL